MPILDMLPMLSDEVMSLESFNDTTGLLYLYNGKIIKCCGLLAAPRQTDELVGTGLNPIWLRR